MKPVLRVSVTTKTFVLTFPLPPRNPNQSTKSQKKLPPGWIQKTTKSGNILYQNSFTGELSTVFPESEETESVPPPQVNIIQTPIDTQVEIASSNDVFGDISTPTPLQRSILDDEDKNGDREPKEKVIERVQEAFTVKLFDHQKEAILWMRDHENHRDYRGGILADDMGCGKTITTLGLVIANPNPKNKRQHTLLVVPFSLLMQWKQEIHDRTKKKYLKKIIIK
mmetsp:Transcript_119587/g.178670  ORF Transcript_119587/g.178670 Transcript_119587/m.178670 type:complete len:224 (+) Transcript_119587:105-776(+)